MVTKKYLQARVVRLQRQLEEAEEERDRYRDSLRADMTAEESAELRAQLAAAKASREELEQEKEQLRREVTCLRQQLDEQQEQHDLKEREAAITAELEQFRAVERARREAKLQEERLLREIAELRERLEGRPGPPTSVGDTSRSETSDLTSGLGDNTALLAQQLQLVEKFGGTQADDQTDLFKDWLEQFETVASAFGWSDRVKQLALTTRLKGPALDFYRTCPSDKKDTYDKLTACLTRRFVPVRLQAVQSCLFSERRQKSGETVDSYAQDLRRLFGLAYPDAARDDSAEGKMSKLVLASQFVAGLRPELKEKLAGAEGDIEQLLVKAKFEEAKRRELRLDREESRVGISATTEQGGQPPTKQTSTESPAEDTKKQRDYSGIICHNCGGRGHIARRCPHRKRVTPKEAEGKRSGNSVVEGRLKTIKSLGTEKTGAGRRTGGRWETEILLEGQPVNALVDTGSPVTIVSLMFLLQLWRERDAHIPVEEWRDWARGVLKKPTLSLQTYDHTALEMAAETEVTLACGEYRLRAAVMVQDAGPQPLLLGTDVLERLGFSLVHGGERKVNHVTNSGVHSVRLLHSTRLPPRHAKLLKVQVEHAQDVGTVMVEAHSEKGALSTEGLWVEPAVVEPDADGYVNLIVLNEGMVPVYLEEKQLLAKAEPVLVESEHDTGEELGDTVNLLSTPLELTEERKRMLCQKLHLSNDNLGLEQRDELIQLTLKYHDVFALDDAELGATEIVEHAIDTADHSPIKQYVRRVPYALRDRMVTLVKEMQDRGVIQPSKSPWASPVVLVHKPDGGIRFCVDYRKLNELTKTEVYPLPRIDDHLDALRGSKYFTTLDLCSGFWQVKMAKDSIEKTAFVTHEGLYEFNVMPFGLKNAPGTFQRLMNTVLAGLVPQRCLDYIDDVLVLGRSWKDHLRNLELVYQRLRDAGLKLKTSKCHLGREKVCYLGFVISPQGVSADPEKTCAVKEFPRPSNIQTLRSFLGLTSYYRRFVPCYSKLAQPLHDLTKKDVAFVWSERCEQAFKELKRRLTEAPILVHPDFTLPFILETDASKEGLGAVLAQRQPDGAVRPIAYASRTLQGAERNYASTHLEALGVVWATQHFRPYLYGHPCTVYTDNQALKSLLNTPHPSGRLARWGLSLQELDLMIQYRPGKQNQNADALSRSQVGKPLTNPPSPAGIEVASSAETHKGQTGTRTREPDRVPSNVSETHNIQGTLLEQVPQAKVSAQESPAQAQTRGQSQSGQLSTAGESGQAFMPPQEGHASHSVSICIVNNSSSSIGHNQETGSLREQQLADPELKPYFQYLEEGTVPDDPKTAKKMAAERTTHEIEDGILYHVEPDGTLRLIPPSTMREKLFEDLHGGQFGAHLGAVKTYGRIRTHYWWPGMRGFIFKRTHNCMICRGRHSGQSITVPLSPLPVGGPFERVAVDVLKLPKSSSGKQYAVVFQDYLTKWPEVYATSRQDTVTIAKLLMEDVVPTHGVPRELLSDRGGCFVSSVIHELY